MFETNTVERLARAAHEIFCEALNAEGHVLGPITMEDKKIHSSLRSYDDLPEEEKEQNRSNVRDIPRKLAVVGYAIVPSTSSKPIPAPSGSEIERLAIMEHERWMQDKSNAGWKHAPKTDKAKKVHKDLVPWEELPEEEKDKDRVLVRAIPGILAKAGYTMVKLSSKPKIITPATKQG